MYKKLNVTILLFALLFFVSPLSANPTDDEEFQNIEFNDIEDDNDFFLELLKEAQNSNQLPESFFRDLHGYEDRSDSFHSGPSDQDFKVPEESNPQQMPSNTNFNSFPTIPLQPQFIGAQLIDYTPSVQWHFVPVTPNVAANATTDYLNSAFVNRGPTREIVSPQDTNTKKRTRDEYEERDEYSDGFFLNNFTLTPEFEKILQSSNFNTLAHRNKRRKPSATELTTHLIEFFNNRNNRQAKIIQTPEEQYQDFCSKFPHSLTTCQENAIAEIKQDFESGTPMYRALVGSVGYGKTEIAIRTAYQVAKAGHQVVILAPLRTLAEQHFKTFQQRFKDTNIKVAHIPSGYKGKQILKQIESGDIKVIIGTHAVFSEKIKYNDIGYVIIDEEHKLGVQQKEALRKNFKDAHVLWMSATLIPRSLALVNEGFMKASYLRTPPSGRLDIITQKIDFVEEEVKQAIDIELNRRGQVFVIVPKIENIQDKLTKLRSFYPEHDIKEVHGAMNKKDIDQRLEDFKNKEFDILIATTIIEVGIDIPNANTMIICDPSPLGMAQLAQLRGRVGRSPVQAYCYVAFDPDNPIENENTLARIEAFVQYSKLGDDMKLAEMDLEQRGAGDLTSDRQKGCGGGWKHIDLDREIELRASTDANPSDLENAQKIPQNLSKDEFLLMGFGCSAQTIDESYPMQSYPSHEIEKKKSSIKIKEITNTKSRRNKKSLDIDFVFRNENLKNITNEISYVKVLRFLDEVYDSQTFVPSPEAYRNIVEKLTEYKPTTLQKHFWQLSKMETCPENEKKLFLGLSAAATRIHRNNKKNL
jgi:RecG-like helicase